MDEKLIETSLTADERVRRVHATQCMVLHQAIRPPARLIMKSTLIAVERRRPGAYVLMRHETRDSRGEQVATVYWGVIYRNVDVTGPDRPSDAPKMPSPPHWDGHLRAEFNIPIGAGLAHIYTACSRQGSPINIHTDTTVARRAGLPAPILMGTATLALSVSKIVVAEAAGNPERVERIFGRFGAMELMPSEITVRITTRAKVDGRDTVFFETMSAEGGRAIRDGAVVLRN
jgi:acyl dehydratase